MLQSYTNQSCMILAQKQTHRSMEENSPEMNPHLNGSHFVRDLCFCVHEWHWSSVFFFYNVFYSGFDVWLHRASLVVQIISICLQCRKLRFDPWVGKIPWRRKWQPTPVFFPGESHGQRSLEGYSPWGHKGQTWLKRLSMHTYTRYSGQKGDNGIRKTVLVDSTS